MFYRLFYRPGLHIPANWVIKSLLYRYGTTLLLYIVPVYHSPTLKSYLQIVVSTKPVFHMCKQRCKCSHYCCFLYIRVVTLVLKIYFTIKMYSDCSSTQICLIHAANVFLELTHLEVCVVQLSIWARHLHCPAII